MPVVRKHLSRRVTTAATAVVLATATVVAFLAAPTAGAACASILSRSAAGTTTRATTARPVLADLVGGISGRVTDASGQGLKGVCVAAFGRGAFEGVVVTGATGSYLIGAVPAGRYRLRFAPCSAGARYATEWYPSAAAAGAGRQIVVTVGHLARAKDVVLHAADRSRPAHRAGGAGPGRRPAISTAAPGSISGTVTDLANAALTGICVFVTGVSPTVGSGVSSTGTGGTYTVTPLPAGTYNVEFMTGCPNSGNFLTQWYKDQSSQTTATPVKVTAGATTKGIGAKLLPGGTIKGRVTNAAGKAFADVLVQAEGTKLGSGFATTSANGTYSMTGLAADDYTVSFTATSGNYLPQWYKGQPSQSTATPVSVAVGATVTGINARMLLGGTISGKVTNTKGAGLSGICVAVNAVGEGAAFFSTGTETRTGGAYTVSLLPTGVYVVGFSNCFSEKTNYAPMWSGGSQTYSSAKGVVVKSGRTVFGVDAKLPVGGSISGRLTNAKGKPLGGLCVSASSQNGSGGEATTTAKGTYSVLSLPTGAYTVSFCGNAAGYISQTYHDDLFNPVSVVVGKQTAQVNATLVLGGKIAGHVANASGKNLAGICVEAEGLTLGSTAGSTISSSSGSYTITGLATGKYAVEFFSGCGNKGSYALQWYNGKASLATATRVSVKNGRTTPHINTKMHVSGTLTGTVVDAGLTPLADICVSVVNKNRNGSGGSASTAGDGTYSVTGLSTGTYLVDFTPDCGTTGNYSAQWYKAKSSQATATTVKVTDGKTTSGIDAKMLAGGTVAGKVTDSKGHALSGICISVSGTNAFGVATTSGAGIYSVDDLSSGKYTVTFSIGCGNSSNLLTQWYKGKPSGIGATSVKVTAGKTTSGINAKMVPGGTLEGTVRNAAGPMLGVCVTVIGSLDTGSATTSITGGFTVTGLGTGKYSVSVSTNFCSGAYLGNYVTEWYNGKSSAASATRVAVTAGKTTSGIRIKMSADGVISGEVSAASGGTKLTGICVEAYDTTVPGPYELAITTKGSYQMVQLMPGSYKVEFVTGCGSTSRFSPQWYNGKPSRSSATSIHVSASRTTRGINAKLTP